MTDHDITGHLNDLIETCKDGEYGFNTCAEHVRSEALKALFSQRGTDCAQAAVELQSLVMRYGGKPDQSGSLGGAVHRGWIAARSGLSQDTDLAVLEECERAEDKALARYRKVLQQPLPAEVVAVVQRQAMGVQRNHDAIRDARDQLRATRGAA